tara:strand:- start:1351 stop:1629 length:279 start_codon:yes stop_codon:yes gene_type:complete
MIDTDRYEGHQVSDFKTSVAGLRHSWVTHQYTKRGAKDAMFVNHATAALVTDAPALLAEVKRLREGIVAIQAGMSAYEDLHGFIQDLQELIE